MKKHQKVALDQFLGLYQSKKEYLAILLAGSIAHGYAKADSDIDVILLVGNEEYDRRKQENKLAFSLWDICKYDGGYIDCKVTCIAMLRDIARKGSDAARYAFQDVQILYTKTEELKLILNEVCRFPSNEKESRQHRFICQLLAWKWYLSQAENKQDQYLVHLASFKIGLFASRTILNYNEMFFPYHKWLGEETKKAKHKPEGFDSVLSDFFTKPTFDQAQKIVDDVLGFLGILEKEVDWPNQFMIDSELNWLNQNAPIDDI